MKGGHLIRKHIALTTGQLQKRLAKETITAASTFADWNEARKGIGAAFLANEDTLGKWIKDGARGTLTIDAPFSGGRVLERGAKSTVTGTGVRVILQGDGAGKFSILTGMLTQ